MTTQCKKIPGVGEVIYTVSGAKSASGGYGMQMVTDARRADGRPLSDTEMDILREYLGIF